MAGIKNVTVSTDNLGYFIREEGDHHLYDSDAHGYILIAPKEAEFIASLPRAGQMKLGMRKDGVWEVKTVTAATDGIF